MTVITILSAGCAQFSAKECTSGDWRSRGVDDGKQGRVKLAQFNQYSAVCRKEHGVTLSSEAYFNGYDEGLSLFCSESNGRSLGEKGIKYLGVCTPALEPVFIAGYNKGLERYCTSGNGANIASQVGRYNGVCPQSLQREFLLGFVPGLEASLPLIESDLFNLRRDLSDLESDLALEKIELRHQRSELSRSKKGGAEYRKRSEIIKRITRENRQREFDIRSVEKRLDRVESDHKGARQQLNTWRPLVRQ